MRLKIINPDTGMTSEEIEERIKKLKKITREDTVISMECPKGGNIEIDSKTDIYLTSGEIIKMAIEAEKEDYDIVGIYCLSDPAIEACRELLKIPVIGGGQSSFQIACGLGYSFSLIVTSNKRIPEKREFIRGSGIDSRRLCSIRSINISLGDIRKDKANIKKLLVEAGKKAIEDGAEVIILGCLSFLGMGEEISEELGIPVIDPAFNLVLMAELIHHQKLSHSKVSYPFPERKNRFWESGNI